MLFVQKNTGMLKGSNERPDILVIESTVSPVVIETEVSPAATVESGRNITSWETDTCYGKDNFIIYCRALAPEMRTKQGSCLQSELENASDIQMAIYTGSDPSAHSRWPRCVDSWGVSNLSFLCSMRQFP